MAKRRNNKAHGRDHRHGEGASAKGRATQRSVDQAPAEPLAGDPHARVAVVGGGAAGLAAAVAAARELRRYAADASFDGAGSSDDRGGAAGQCETSGSGGLSGTHVVVLEADERVGRSILATGNGRCNFSNAHIDAGCYRNAPFVGNVLMELLRRDAASTTAEEPVLRFFRDLGLAWREEGEGRMYPATGKASTVVDVLRAAMANLGVVEACGRTAVRIDPPKEAGGLYHIRFADGSVEHAAAVVVATGGVRAATHGLLPERYGTAPVRPVLGPLAVSESEPRALNNIRTKATVWLAAGEGAPVPGAFGPDACSDEELAAAEARRAWADGYAVSDAAFAPSPAQASGAACGGLRAVERGEVLFRGYGISGICVFNLSRFARPGDVLLVDLLPDVRAVDCTAFLLERRHRLASPKGALGGLSSEELTGAAVLRGLLLPAVAQAVLRRAGLDPDAPFAKADAERLARALKAFALTVEGPGDARQCQVMRGGLDVAAFGVRTLESRLDAGLFAAGEALDVDAPCGGYNLHWAWASGLLAGIGAAQRVRSR